MGRFDALTNLTEDKDTQIPSPVVSSSTPHDPTTKERQDAHDKNKNHEIIKSGKSETPPLPNTSGDKPIKYSTLIDPALVKKIKLHVAERIERLRSYRACPHCLFPKTPLICEVKKS